LFFPKSIKNKLIRIIHNKRWFTERTKQNKPDLHPKIEKINGLFRKRAKISLPMVKGFKLSSSKIAALQLQN